MSAAARTISLTLAALVASLAGGAAALDGSLGGAGLSLAAAILIMISALFTLRARRSSSQRDTRLVQKVAEQVEAGRKLAIYERETGLFAHWYIALRGQEECDRAARYKHALTLLLIEPAETSDAWSVKANIVTWLQKHMRASDVAGYLGNGRCIALLAESDLKAAKKAVARLKGDVAAADTGHAVYPQDGAEYDKLYAVAAQRLGDAAARAA